MSHPTPAAFTKGQRVRHQRLLGPTFAKNWDEQCTVVDGRPTSVSPTSGDWYLVKFDDGGQLRIHEEGLRAA